MEVLLATGLFAVVIGLASSMFARSLRYYGESQTMTDNMMQMKIFANRVSDEFSSVLPPVAAGNVTEFSGNATVISALVLGPRGVNELTYAFEPGLKRIVRRSGSDDRDFLTFDTEETAVRNVESAAFTFYNGTAWSDAPTAKIPRAVKFVCTLAKGFFRETLQEIIYIPVGE